MTTADWQASCRRCPPPILLQCCKFYCRCNRGLTGERIFPRTDICTLTQKRTFPRRRIEHFPVKLSCVQLLHAR